MVKKTLKTQNVFKNVDGNEIWKNKKKNGFKENGSLYTATAFENDDQQVWSHKNASHHLRNIR